MHRLDHTTATTSPPQVRNKAIRDLWKRNPKAQARISWSVPVDRPKDIRKIWRSKSDYVPTKANVSNKVKRTWWDYCCDVAALPVRAASRLVTP